MTQTIGIIMNSITGRMGHRQHLVRPILEIRDQGGVLLATMKQRYAECVLPAATTLFADAG